MTKHLHHLFWACKERTESGVLIDISEVEVIGCTTENNALDRVKQLVVRPVYHLKKVWECKACGLQEQQKKLMEDLSKHLKDEKDDI